MSASTDPAVLRHWIGGDLDDGPADGASYGNGAAIFTNDGGAARRFEQDAAAGMIGVNVPIPLPMAYHSFGGWKQSLFGDLHVHGPDGVRFNTCAKVVTRRWPDPLTAASTSAFPSTPRGACCQPIRNARGQLWSLVTVLLCVR